LNRGFFVREVQFPCADSDDTHIHNHHANLSPFRDNTISNAAYSPIKNGSIFKSNQCDCRH
jgi:hypothetical protein